MHLARFFVFSHQEISRGFSLECSVEMVVNPLELRDKCRVVNG